MKKLLVIILTIFSLFSLVGCESSKDTKETNGTWSINESTKGYYDVSNDYFFYTGFKTGKIVNTDKLGIEINGQCLTSLFYVSANTTLYANDNSIIKKFTKGVNTTYVVNREFSIVQEITEEEKKNISHISVSFSGYSYEPLPSTDSYNFNVTFVNNNESQNTIVSNIKFGQVVSMPTTPIKPNHIFLSWCTDEKLQNTYDFSKSINHNLTLYAKYTIDYATLYNKINTDTIKANVKIVVKSYTTSFLGKEKYALSSGSGVIFGENNDYYFLLTNNHVVKKVSGYDSVKYTVKNYKGTEYNGTLMHSSAEYDLATIYFKKSKESLSIISREKVNADPNGIVFAMGQPEGQNNSVSNGIIKEYKKITLSATPITSSNVKFDVMIHDCQTDQGSSGGAIINADLKLIGIHYAGAEDDNGAFVYGCAIPIEKVNEYLDKYIWKK